jgi:hypothetical protein
LSVPRDDYFGSGNERERERERERVRACGLERRREFCVERGGVGDGGCRCPKDVGTLGR